MRNINTAIAYSFAKALWQTMPLVRDACSGRSERRYLSLQAHPDDEILKAGIDQRIITHTPDPIFLTFTDGNKNTDQDRVAELNKSFRILGYKGDVECLLHETDILDRVCTEQGAPCYIDEKNIRHVADILREKIAFLEKLAQEKGVNTIITTDYSGGHFIHDMANMVATLAARRLSRRRQIEVYEFPQYFLSINTNLGVNPRYVQTVIEEIVKENSDGQKISTLLAKLSGVPKEQAPSLENLVNYSLAKFTPPLSSYEENGLTDPAIGMYHGAIHLTLPEIIRKIRTKSAHDSQKRSLQRMLKHCTSFGDFSIERVRKVPLDRDFSKRPNTNVLLYEIIPWRPHADFDTFRRIYHEIKRLKHSNP